MRFLTLVSFVVLVFPAYAEARPFSNEENAAYNWAISYWGQKPTQCAQVELRALDIADLGEATMPDPIAPPNSVQCSLSIDTIPPLSPLSLCTVMTHEVGHLLGYEHSDDFANPMSISGVFLPCIWESERREMASLVRQLPARCRALSEPTEERRRCWEELRWARKRLQQIPPQV